MTPLAGNPDEAAAALADCADHAAPHEKRDYARGLGQFGAERPSLAAQIYGLQQILSATPATSPAREG
jgi:hypothetical protein